MMTKIDLISRASNIILYVFFENSNVKCLLLLLIFLNRKKLNHIKYTKLFFLFRTSTFEYLGVVL